MGLVLFKKLDVNHLGNLSRLRVISNRQRISNRVPFTNPPVHVEILKSKAMIANRLFGNIVDVVMLGTEREDKDGALERPGDFEIGLEFPIMAERVSHNDRDRRTITTSPNHLTLVPRVGNPEKVGIEMVVMPIDEVHEELVRLENKSIPVLATNVGGEGGLPSARSAADENHGSIVHCD